MSDEVEVTTEQTEYYKYATGLVDEMNELFRQHEDLVAEYSRAMEYIALRDWREGYVLWTAGDGKMEGRDDGQRGD